MIWRDEVLKIVRAIEHKLDPPYVPATPEQRLLDAIFSTAENRPWPAEVQPMPGNMWRGDHDDYDWACYVADAVNARVSTPLGALQVVHSILGHVATATKDKQPSTYAAAHQAEKTVCIFLDRLEDAPPHYYDPEYGDETPCQCGHWFYYHFDTYDDMEPAGCKDCDCDWFRKASDEPEK